jgi:CubicO group peptidase (beta-lactamase class C family)
MRSHEISNLLQERINPGDFPSAVYLVAEKGEIVFQDALGYAVVEPQRIKAELDTVYDVASLTKPLVTGLLYAALFDSGGIEHSLPFYFREMAIAKDKNDIDFLDLLTHRSGFPAWQPFYLTTKHEGRRLSNLIPSIPLECPVRTRVVYSDINFILLGLAYDRITGRTLAASAERNIFEALSLERSLFHPPMSMRPSIAASEKGNEYEKQSCVELGYLKESDEIATPSLFRDYQIWGEVHDGNAWFMGGVAGHAGLFSTVGEVFKIALQFLPNYTTILKPETTQLFRTNFTAGMNEDRSFAFQLASTEGSTAGAHMSTESFGHNGFTGTSLWVDPVKERIFILLTNRTHAHSLPFVNINSVRRRFHDLAIQLLDQNR